MSKSWCVVIGNVNEYCVGFKKVVKKSLLKASLVNKSQPKCDNVRIDHVEDMGGAGGAEWCLFQRRWCSKLTNLEGTAPCITVVC